MIHIIAILLYQEPFAFIIYKNESFIQLFYFLIFISRLNFMKSQFYFIDKNLKKKKNRNTRFHKNANFDATLF